jgi:hypothetical protein
MERLTVNVLTGEVDIVKLTDQEIADLAVAEEARIAEEQARFDALPYTSKRAKEYPSFADQFDLLYHGGYDAWKAAIEVVKVKYPKPE